MTAEDRLTTLETRMGKLEGGMDALTKEVRLLRQDLEGAFYGSDHDPQKTEQMKRFGLIRKLDKLDEIAELLRERLPAPPRDEGTVKGIDVRDLGFGVQAD